MSQWVRHALARLQQALLLPKGIQVISFPILQRCFSDYPSRELLLTSCKAIREGKVCWTMCQFTSSSIEVRGVNLAIQ